MTAILIVFIISMTVTMCCIGELETKQKTSQENNSQLDLRKKVIKNEAKK